MSHRVAHYIESMRIALAPVVLTALTLAGRSPSMAAAQSRAADSAAVTRALEHYTGLMRRMASDSIGAMFTPSGELVGTGRPPVVGPAAISAFLASFSTYHVLADSMHATSFRFSADTIVQQGTFWQQVQVPAGDTVIAHGGFEATWVRDGHGNWRVRRMGTTP